jgi:hypothetical protein
MRTGANPILMKRSPLMQTTTGGGALPLPSRVETCATERFSVTHFRANPALHETENALGESVAQSSCATSFPH